jgi:hypothetical protein
MAENICHAPLLVELDAYHARLCGLTARSYVSVSPKGVLREGKEKGVFWYR